jgi:hypothetical protein
MPHSILCHIPDTLRPQRSGHFRHSGSRLFRRSMTRRIPRPRLMLAALAAAGLAAVIVAHDVPVGLTADDREYAPLILAKAGYDGTYKEGAKPAYFEGEVAAILAVQNAVLTLAPKDAAIAFDRPREPKDLYELGHGLCFDRSRVIEKLLGWLGFTTRHVSIYGTKDSSALVALLTPESPSHAVSEVLTQKGWMAIDSNRRWIGLDAERNAVSVADLQSKDAARKTWAPEVREAMQPILKGPFVKVRGLYSRHGHFYAPYTAVPDYNLGQLAGNLLD